MERYGIEFLGYCELLLPVRRWLKKELSIQVYIFYLHFLASTKAETSKQ